MESETDRCIGSDTRSSKVLLSTKREVGRYATAVIVLRFARAARNFISSLRLWRGMRRGRDIRRERDRIESDPHGSGSSSERL